MSMYEACAKIGMQLGSVTTPVSFATVRVVPPGHGDDRHAARPGIAWCNIEPVVESHMDETNDSDLVTYTVRFHAWYARPDRSITTIAQNLGTLAQACVDTLKHSTLGGWTRHGIALADIAISYDTVAADDVAYVVRGDVTIHRQQ